MDLAQSYLDLSTWINPNKAKGVHFGSHGSPMHEHKFAENGIRVLEPSSMGIADSKMGTKIKRKSVEIILWS